MSEFKSVLGDEMLHFTGSLHCNGDYCEVSKQLLTSWAASVIAKDKRIAEIEAELGKYTSAEANDYGKAVKRIAELEAQLEQYVEKARQWDMHNCTTHAMNLAAENRRLHETIEILKGD